jgi:hypothetical protein
VATLNNIHELKINNIDNLLCGANSCNKPANRRLFFSVGFSANFCAACADELIQEGLGAEKPYLNKEMKALELVGEPRANAIYNIQSNSKESLQRK